MPTVKVYDMTGNAVSEIELSDNIFGIEPNKTVMHEMVVNHLANRRQGTQSTLTRAEVRGGGRKPWRQKGTGRARQGSIRAPQWYKGGVALGPKPRDYSYSINKKVKRLALKSALSTKVLESKIVVVDSICMNEFKNKGYGRYVDCFENRKKALIVLPETNLKVVKSARNLKGVKTSLVNTINVYDILNYDTFVVTKDAVAKIEEVYT